MCDLNNFINNVITPGFADKHNFLANENCCLTVEKRGAWHLFRSKSTRDSQMTRAAELIKRLGQMPWEFFSSKTEAELATARENLDIFKTRMITNASTELDKQSIGNSMDSAIRNFKFAKPLLSSSFLKSLFWHSQGTYQLGGYWIDFSKGVFNPAFMQISYVVHELGHALANQFFTGKKERINIGQEGSFVVVDVLMPWKNSVVCFAGPFANMTFSSWALVAATIFRNAFLSVKQPTNIYNGIAFVAPAYFITIPLTWMVHELYYAATSTYKADNGDFAKIAKINPVHHAIATTALVSQFALGVFACFKLI